MGVPPWLNQKIAMNGSKKVKKAVRVPFHRTLATPSHQNMWLMPIRATVWLPSDDG